MKSNSALLVFFAAFSLVSAHTALAQCTSFTKKKCMPDLLPYIHNGQMNTVNLAPGESASLKAAFYSGQDYKIFVCSHKVLENVYFEVRNSDDDLVYSNKESKKENWNFNVASTQELSINVFVPQLNSPSGMPQAGCVAVLIGFKE
jgi:hypothetical protein